MNWVDAILLVLVALSAVHGLRLGAAMQVLSFGGFWLGLFTGALIAPLLAHGVHAPATKALVAVVTVFGFAALFGGLGRLAGIRSADALQRLDLGTADSVVGVIVAVVATLLAAWLVANLFVSSSRYTTLNAGIQGSRIIRALDSVMPAPPTVFSRVASFLGAEGFPIVFSGMPPVAARSVPPPSNAQLAEAVDAAQASTVKIQGFGCGAELEGSGFVIAAHYVLTNAHVVAGIRAPEVVDQLGEVHATTVVLFDPELDVAVLRVPSLSEPVLRLDPDMVRQGTTGAVLGFPGGGPFNYQAAGVLASFNAVGYDIYGRSQTDREVYEIQATPDGVRPGNSGGPLVEPDGTVIGVVFARSTTTADVGYALASPGVLRDVGPAIGHFAAVSTGGCTD